MKPEWNTTRTPISGTVARWILSKIENMKFGDVKISVRAGKIVQINREEKERYNEVDINR
ncbi:MAG: DUF2292 domain-containing protein [Candidatus Hydrogenedentes bacterium]|nr:DUF2292 domain-containing protein [Candidatus Hydrogenedentota bacterium]